MELVRSHDNFMTAKNERVHADLWWSESKGYKLVIVFEVDSVHVATVTITDQYRALAVWQDIVS